MADIRTIEQYLNGKVRNITVPDNTIASILLDAGCGSVSVEEKIIDEETGEETLVVVDKPIDKDTDVSLLSLRERELCLAWLYVWIAGSPTQSGGYTEEDADWRSSGDSERMSAKTLSNYLAMANKIFEKYGLETVSTGKWGMVGRGLRYIRHRVR